MQSSRTTTGSATNTNAPKFASCVDIVLSILLSHNVIASLAAAAHAIAFGELTHIRMVEGAWGANWKPSRGVWKLIHESIDTSG